MWGWIKDKARSIGRGIGAGLSVLIKAVGYAIHRIFGIPELIISLLGFKPAKKLRLKVLILRDASGTHLASIADVEAVVDAAKLVFQREANIRIIPPDREPAIVQEFADQNPSFVLTPKCDTGGHAQMFTQVGSWFRAHCGPYARQGGATVFIVEDVIDKGGCFTGPLVDYGYVDDTALNDSAGVPATGGRRLTLAHELAHACDLLHRDDQRNLMAPSDEDASGVQRTSAVTRWQRSVIRSSPRVRYI